jgi:hypothetical protein
MFADRIRKNSGAKIVLILTVLGFWGQERFAPAQEASFSQTLYPVLEKAACSACHNSDGVASATRLIFPEQGAKPETIEAFGLGLVELVDRKNPQQSLLLRKPTNRIAHAGGERIKRDSEGDKALLAWVERLTRATEAELSAAKRTRENAPAHEDVRPGASMRRLTHSQYNNTIRDLLGDQSAPANQFPPEDFLNGFKNQTQAQTLSPILVEAYGDAAERIARNAFQGGDRRGLLSCKPSTACRDSFIREFGQRAFRRPLDAGEEKRYQALFARETDFYRGAQLTVEAMLQSPNFLFRLDESSRPEWKPYVTASRLAYAFWDSMPDQALIESAARGELSTPAGVEAAARRMLDDPRAHKALDEFISQWMRFDRLLTAGKDRRRFPMFSREVAAAMTEESRSLIADLVWNDRNFMEIFTADYSFLNADLAAIYGVKAPAKEFERTPIPAESDRRGLLGQGLFLALTSKPDDTSPTARGLFIREQFLCQHVAEPPPGVNTNLPPITESRPQTNRDRLSEHVNNPSCSTCHNLIDPIGFGFERFDAIGARRDKFKLYFTGPQKETKKKAEPQIVELEMDTSGYIAGVPDSKFSSPRELGGVLAGSAQCQECVAKQYYRYIAGRMELNSDRNLLKSLTQDFKNSQFRFKELMISMARRF